MEPFIRKLLPGMALALCAPLMGGTAVRAAEAVPVLPYDCLTTDADGRAVCTQGGAPVSGRLILSPAILLGDVNRSGDINAQDAAALLMVSAQIGVGSVSVTDSEWSQLLAYGDVDSSGSLNAIDAALILSYSAGAGTGGTVLPLGASLCCADASGHLLTGWIELASGETCYAGADCKLRTGWMTLDGATYCFDKNGCMQKNTWVTARNSAPVWLGADGRMAAGAWAMTDKGLCWFDTDGMAADGLRMLGDKAYYFADCTVQTGWIDYNGRTCYAGAGGALCTGLTVIGNATYYFGQAYDLQTGWIQLDDGLRYFDENGRMCTGWTSVDGVNYCFDENGVCLKGFIETDEGIYYLDESGSRCTGWQDIRGEVYYFQRDTALMTTGWTTLNGLNYYFNENGTMHTGWLELDGKSYYFQEEDGIMATGRVQVDGKTYDFGSDGVSRGEYVPPASNTGTGMDDLLNNASLSPRRSITVYDQQKASGKEKVDFTFTLKDKDIAIIEQFAAEHFPENSSIAEKLYITHQWIHYNTDYAYAGAKWNEIVGLSYVDAIFNHRKGQCVQYNGAMASVLAYYGYEVYMVKGYTRPGVQHFWTQVEIDGHTYMVECGNSGKNGDSWQYFFKKMY